MKLEEDEDSRGEERHRYKREENKCAALVSLQEPEERSEAEVRRSNKVRHEIGDKKESAYNGKADGDVPFAPWWERDTALQRSNDDLESEDKLNVRYNEDRYRVFLLVVFNRLPACNLQSSVHADLNVSAKRTWKHHLRGNRAPEH